MNHLLNICQEWDEVLTPKREELKEWGVCHKCARWTYDKHCSDKGMV